MNRVSRPVPVSEVTVLNIKTVVSLYKYERYYEPKERAMVIDAKNWVKILEDMYEFLYQRLGTTSKEPFGLRDQVIARGKSKLRTTQSQTTILRKTS